MTTHRSPRGRLIDEVTGEADEIISRAQMICDLGDTMADCADWLATIKDDAAEQQGRAIEELRTSIGDSAETLAKAADLYRPVGPVLKTYGEELTYLQPKISGLVESCRERGADVPSIVAPEPEDSADDDPEAEQARAAKEAWEEEAALFDAAYDEWEEAFDTAVNGITDEMAGAIEDDLSREILDVAGKFLEVAGLVVAVLAIVIGGPALFWVALIVGVLALAVTIGQAWNGDKDGWDIALAALGAIPFGKAGTAFAKVAGKLGGTKLLTGTAMFGGKAGAVPSSNSLAEMGKRAFSGKDTGDFVSDVLTLRSSNFRPDRLGAQLNDVGGYAEAGIKFYTGSLAIGNWVG